MLENHQLEPQVPAKKGRRTQTYGVDPSKAGGKKPGKEAVEAISKANSEEDYNVRESVYENYRTEIQYHLR